MELMIEDLMEQLIEMGGSDLHLTAGLPLLSHQWTPSACGRPDFKR